MALVKDIVTRFKFEAQESMAKMDAYKAKNREVAESILGSAKSHEQAIAVINAAKAKGALGDFGIDTRQVSGIIKSLKDLKKEAEEAGNGTEAALKKIASQAKRAGGLGDIQDAVGFFAQGDILKGIEKYKKGMGDVVETGGFGGAGSAAFVLTAMQLIGDKLAVASGKAADLSMQFRAGKIESGEMIEGLIGSLPIVGGLWQTGRNIRETITGENAELAKQLVLMQNIATAADKSRAARNDRLAWHNQFADEMDSSAQQVKADALRRSGAVGTADEMESQNKRSDELKKSLKAIKDKYTAEINAQEEMKRMNMQKFMSNGGTSQDYLNTQNNDKVIADLKKKRDADEWTALQNANANVLNDWKNKHDDKTVDKVDEEGRRDKWAKESADRVKAEDEATSKITALRADAEKSLLSDVGQKVFDIQQKAKDQKTATDQLANAQDLQGEFSNANSLRQSEGDIDKNSSQQITTLLSTEAKKLLKDKKAITDKEGFDLSGKNVYDLPDTKTIRSGSTLFAPPSKVDQSQLDKLSEINEGIKKLIAAAAQGGVVIEELQGDI